MQTLSQINADAKKCEHKALKKVNGIKLNPKKYEAENLIRGMPSFWPDVPERRTEQIFQLYAPT